jgi:hypothetical protein
MKEVKHVGCFGSPAGGPVIASEFFTDQMASVDPALLDWTGRENKRRIDAITRERLADTITQDRDTPVKCLTFPADLWLWEQGLAEAFPQRKFHVMGVEKSPKVFDRAKIVRPLLQKLYSNLTLSLSRVPRSFKQVLNSIPEGEQFDIIYPDYMGTWARPKRAEVSQIFEKNLLAVGGFLLLTLSLNRGRAESIDELKAYARGEFDVTFTDHRRKPKPSRGELIKVQGVPGLIQDLAAAHGCSLQLLEPHIYYNLNNGSPTPEVFFAFRRLP